MTAFLCVVSTFALIVTLLRLNWRVGRALMAGVLFLMATLGVSPGDALAQIVANWQIAPRLSKTFVAGTADILLLVTMVNILGQVMAASGISGRMPDALVTLMRSRRMALGGVPAIMGLLPTPGGIMLSASLVKDMARRFGVEPWRAALVNYWFRHIWEYSFPLYPAIPIVLSILNGVPDAARVGQGRLVLFNSYLVVASFAVGAFFLLRGFPVGRGRPRSARKIRHAAMEALMGLFPVALTMVLYAVVGLTVGLSVTVAVLLLAAIQRVPLPVFARMVRRGLHGDFLLAVFMAIFFGQVLEAAGAVQRIGAFIASTGMPPAAVIFLLPLIVGATTGITSAALGMTFPLLTVFLFGPDGEVWLGGVALGFCGGLMGIFLTPVHICLTLTRSYFNVPFGALYRRLGPIALTMAVLAFAVALLTRP